MSTFHEGADFDKFAKEYLTRVQNKQIQKNNCARNKLGKIF